jgi:hypothetical protein
MKTKILFLLLVIPFFSMAKSQDKNEEHNRESTKISLYIPGFILKTAALFISKEKNAETKKMLKSMRSISITVRDGAAYSSYKSSKKYNKKLAVLDQRHFESLAEVSDTETKASIFIHQNKKEKIRQLVIMADDGSGSFVFARLRCNLNLSELKNLLSEKEVQKNLPSSFSKWDM